MLFEPKKKKMVFFLYPQRALNAAGAVSTGKVRSGVVAQPPSDREAGEDTSSRGRGVADVRQRATSLLCATPPPGFSGCERRTEFPGKKIKRPNERLKLCCRRMGLKGVTYRSHLFAD